MQEMTQQDEILANRRYMWNFFTKVSLWGGIFVAAILAIMALFLT